ncbi:hypothetical protein N0V93_004488 [Gnomoniopsis smithogilvyi]|uniref:Uncharacterized protein n=1 Tax=Gnomoniopsis smithogilvyi TaxID=1191159 RepID=A0A9W9CX70_9PEZI|nr:hypothetical protein N0V93_004488 [Gnomoniopsis smithogilvyi]
MAQYYTLTRLRDHYRTVANPEHITKFGQLLDGVLQKNTEAELHLIVYHDEERKLYQHRFIEAALGFAAISKAAQIAEKFGFGVIGDENFIGEDIPYVLDRKNYRKSALQG